MNVELKQALERVAGRTREVRLWGGLALCWATWALVGLVLVAAGFRSAGVVAAFVGLALASGIAWTVVSLRSARDLRGVARRVEAAHPDLDAGLLAAVDERPADDSGRRGYLQEAVAARALEHHYTHDWTSVVSQKAVGGTRLAHLAAFCGLAGVTLAMALRVRPESASEAAPLPLASATAEVQVTPGDVEIEKGSPLLVVARFPGAVPPDARLVVEGGDAASESHGMTRSLEDPMFAGRVDSVARDVTYRVEFADGGSPTYRVRVFVTPELQRTDAKLEFPAYTSIEPKTVEDVRHVTAVEGTKVSLQFRLNKEVASAKLVDEKGAEVSLTPPADPASPVYGAELTLTDSHRYKVQLLDREGRKNKLSADLGVNVTRNRPPTITMSQPARDMRVSPVEELRLKAQATDDFGVVRRGVNYVTPGGEPRDVVLGGEETPRPKRVQMEHLIDFEALKAVPDQLVSYFVWAEDYGPDGKVRRTEGDMYFAEVRHFEEIFRQGEQPSDSSASEEEQQGGGQGQQAEQLAELQKQVINGTWKVLRREIGPKPTDQLAPDAKILRESQEAALAQATALGERLTDAGSKAALQAALKSMQEAARLLGESSDKASAENLHPALSAEQLAYQALLKLRAREFEVTRRNSRQTQRGGGGASASQRQLNQLELTDQENRFEEQTRARQQETQKEQEQRETRQVVNRLKELAQRQADLNDRLKELQASLEAAKDEPARQEIERQLKRLRDQQQQILRDTDELQERMETQQNRERMAEARQQVQEGREHVRRASEALEEGRTSQALTEGTRAGRQLADVRDELRKEASNQFAEDLTEMRDQARRLEEEQSRLSEKLDAWKASSRQTLRDPADRQQVKQGLEQQGEKLGQLLERMRTTVGEAEEAEPLLARNLFDAVRKADEQAIPNALDQAGQLADAGFAQEASGASHRAGEGLGQLREGVERAARNILGDETAALRRAQGEVDDLADQINREIAMATGDAPDRPGANGANPGPDGERPPAGRGRPGERDANDTNGGQDRGNEQGDERQAGRPGDQEGQDQQGPEGRQAGQGQGRQDQQGRGRQGRRGQQGEGQEQGQGQQGQDRQGQGQQGQGQEGEGQQGQNQAGREGQRDRAQSRQGQQGQGQQGQGQQGQQGQGQQGQQGQQGRGEQGQGQQGQGGQGGRDQQGQGQQGQGGQGGQQGQRQQGQQGRQGGRQGGSLRGGPAQQEGQDAQGGPGGNQGGRRSGFERMFDGMAGGPNGPGGPITGEGFREWSDRMRDVEELLEDPDLRAEAARIRDRVRGAREEFKRHSKEPDWTKLKGLVADPIRELRDRIAEEVRRRESPDSLVPIDRDPVPPQFAEGVRRYYERLGSGR